MCVSSSSPWPTFVADFLNLLQVSMLEVLKISRLSCAQPMTFGTRLVVTLVAFKAVLLLLVVYKLAQERKRLATFDKIAAAHVTGVRRGMVTTRTRRSTAASPSTTEAPGNDGNDGKAFITERASVVGTDVQRLVKAARLRAGSDGLRARAGRLGIGQLLRRANWGQVLKFLFQFLVVAYPGVSVTTLKTFKCVNIEDTWYLQADLRERCFTPAWWALATYATAMASVYTAGLPLLLTLRLRQYRNRLTSKEALQDVGFLYQVYGPHTYFWEVLELLRKLALSSLLIYFEQGSILQVTCAVVICAWASMLHGVYKPFKRASTYYLQHASLQTTFIVFVIGLLFKVRGACAELVVPTTCPLMAIPLGVSPHTGRSCANVHRAW